jgi:MFS family permease
VYGTLSTILAGKFFSDVNPSAAFVFTLLAFAAGFAVRPLGALIFGRLGDTFGRKYTFLVTITLMGLGTCFIGILPTFATWGIAAPILLITCRLVQVWEISYIKNKTDATLSYPFSLLNSRRMSKIFMKNIMWGSQICIWY